jgi:hypothetical protein
MISKPSFLILQQKHMNGIQNSNCRNKSKKRIGNAAKGTSIVLQSSNRTSRDVDVLFALGKQVLIGFNDLQTKFPDIAAEHMDGIQGQ